jgi:hypothetical protein
MLDSGTMPSPRRTWAEAKPAASAVMATAAVKEIDLRNGILPVVSKGETLAFAFSKSVAGQFEKRFVSGHRFQRCQQRLREERLQPLMLG